MDPKPLTIDVVLGFLGGTPRGVWGPSLAECRDPGRGRQFSRLAAKTHIFGSFGGVGGPPGGSGAQAGRLQGPGPPGPVRRGGNPLAPNQIPETGRGGRPHQPCLKREKLFFALLSSNPYRVPLLLVERPAQAARTHNPTVIHFGSVYCETHIFCKAARGSREQESPP